MAITLQITDGTTTFDLVYNSSTQPYYHSRKGLLVISEDTDVLQHQPDNGEPSPIRANDMDRTVVFDSDVLGADQDEVLDKITALKRFIDGKDQQALRYWTEGDVDRVDLKMQLENATNYTLSPIKWGHVDDSGAHYTAAAQNSGYAIGIRITLHLTPYGEGAAITLRNDLASSPHFLEDSNSDGLADGWAAFVNAPTTTLVTTRYLIGGQCQRMVCSSTAQTEGIQATAVTASTSSTAVAYVWVHAGTPASDDVLTIRLSDGSNNTIDTVTFDPNDPTANADKTAVGSVLNRTWYRHVVSGTNSTAANFSLRVYRNVGDASAGGTYFIDGAYLYVGSTTAPDAWSSTAAIRNRYDPVTANPERINHIDVWGIPGDSDALVDQNLDITAVTGTKNGYIIGKVTDGAILATSGIHWVDNTDIEYTIISGSQSEPADATRSAGEYDRYTADGTTPAAATVRITIGSTFSDFVNTMAVDRRVFAIARSSSTATTIELSQSSLLFYNVNSSAVTLNVANTWELVDLGLLKKISPIVSDYHTTTGLIVSGKVTPTVASATFDIDAILLVPATEDGYSIVGEYVNGVGLSTSNNIYVLGSKQAVVFSQGRTDDAYTGTIWTCRPGNKMTRYIYTMIDMSGTDTHHLTDATTVTMTVTPRTRHLLGTS